VLVVDDDRVVREMQAAGEPRILDAVRGNGFVLNP